SQEGRGIDAGLSLPSDSNLAQDALTDNELGCHILRCVFYQRARELGKPLPVAVAELDLEERGPECLVAAVKRYVRSRDQDPFPPNHLRNAIQQDISVLMADLAKPGHVFRGAAVQTAIEVA